MNKAKWLLELLFKALGLHDGTKKLLLVFILLTVIQMPYSVPGLWKTGWGIYLSWKNNLLPTTASATAPPTALVDTPVAGGSRTHSTRRPQ